MSFNIFAPKKRDEFHIKKLLALKKFDGKLSLYFLSNTINNEELKLDVNSTFSNVEKRIKGFEELLKEFKEKSLMLEKELDGNNK